MLSARSWRGAAWLSVTIGTSAVGLPTASEGSARPRARASRACAYQNTPVWRASAAELRSAVICLINRFRGRGGLPGLREHGQLDGAAQGHDNQMVNDRFFGHGGVPASSPSLRISAAGFRWGAYGEAISTGYWTPRRVVQAWLSSAEHCRILLSPQYRYIGVGVNARPVAGWTRRPGTWTADLALPLGWGAPSGNWGPASGCPQ
jgi:uncharacterized protein YkwD